MGKMVRMLRKDGEDGEDDENGENVKRGGGGVIEIRLKSSTAMQKSKSITKKSRYDNPSTAM